MSEKHINKLNVNPFLGGLIFQAFYFGYEKKECPLLLHYLVLPVILYGTTRNYLLTINKNNTLASFSAQNKLNMIDLQERIWGLKHLTSQSLIVLHNKNHIKLNSNIEVINSIDYNNYDDDLKKYFRAATYLGILLKTESIENIFKILKVIP